MLAIKQEILMQMLQTISNARNTLDLCNAVKHNRNKLQRKCFSSGAEASYFIDISEVNRSAKHMYQHTFLWLK